MKNSLFILFNKNELLFLIMQELKLQQLIKTLTYYNDNFNI